MMVQAPLRALVDPRKDPPTRTEGNHTRRQSHRYPCRVAARMRMDRAVHDVQFLDVGYGGGRVLAPGNISPRKGVEAQVIARTESGVYGDNVVVVDSEPAVGGAGGTVIRFKLSDQQESPHSQEMPSAG